VKEEAPNQDTPHLILIDGYGFVFRAYHSMPPLTRPDGTPVGAVLGFTNMLLKFVEKHAGDHVAIILDAGEKTFRNEIYDQYKANRPPAPEDLKPQFPLVRQAAEALNLPVIDKKGYEADDIIATYTRMAKEAGYRVTVVSSDKDLMQLVDEPQVCLFDPMKSKPIGKKEVEEKFGVSPERVLDVLSLMGDSSDNVPGVPGIGQKTAAELIVKYGDLETLLDSADEIKQPKRRQNLQENKDAALLSKRLIRLDSHVELDTTLDGLTLREFDRQRFVTFLEEQNFKNLIQRFKGDDEPASVAEVVEQPKAVFSYTAFESLDALKQWLQTCDELRTLALLPLYDKKGTLQALALAVNDTMAGYLRVSEEVVAQDSLFADADVAAGVHLDGVLSLLKPYLADSSIKLVGYNLKWLFKLGYVPAAYDDVMSMSYVVGAGKYGHSFSEIVGHYLSSESVEFWEEGKEELLQKAGGYLVELHRVLQAELFEQRLLSVYQRIEKPLIPVIAQMEKTGIAVDVPLLNNLSKGFLEQIEALEKDIFDLSGEDFNVGSPKQLGEVLFEKMGIEGGKKSKKSGAYGTGADVLEALSADGHKIADKVLQWRQLSKLKSTYTDALPNEVAVDGRIHSHFSLASTSTGRLSSHDPNLQNIPIRSDEGNKIREAFIPETGNLLISADYSQIELRLLAHVAGIDVLKEAFAQGKDIHSVTASQMFGVAESDVTSDLRRRAKMINFGIIYGMSAFGLAHRLGISRTEAADYIEQYFKQYPGIRHYMEETIHFCRAHGWVQTIFGRKCYIPAINDKNPMRRQFSERAAINAPLQGAAADIIKKAMVNLSLAESTKAMGGKMVLQVHDELLFEVSAESAQLLAENVKRMMESVVQLDVPLKVEVGVGKNWSEIH
jgi:DNA polymerase-1